MLSHKVANLKEPSRKENCSNSERCRTPEPDRIVRPETCRLRKAPYCTCPTKHFKDQSRAENLQEIQPVEPSHGFAVRPHLFHPKSQIALKALQSCSGDKGARAPKPEQHNSSKKKHIMRDGMKNRWMRFVECGQMRLFIIQHGGALFFEWKLHCHQISSSTAISIVHPEAARHAVQDGPQSKSLAARLFGLRSTRDGNRDSM